MKYLLILLMLTGVAYAQEPSYTPMKGNYRFKGIKVDSLFLIPSFADTTTANATNLDSVAGAFIRTGNDFWMRNAELTSWLQNVNIGPGSSPVGLSLQNVLDNNHDLDSGQNYQGTVAGAGNTGMEVIAIGSYAANNNTGDWVTALGLGAADSNTGIEVNVMGGSAAYYNHGSYVNAIGFEALTDNTGDDVNTMGSGGAFSNEGNYVNAFGNLSAFHNTGNYVNAIGYEAAHFNIGENVNALGTNAGDSNTQNNLNALGYNAAYHNSGADVNAFGANAGNGNPYNNVTLLGNNSTATADKQLVLSDGTYSTRINYEVQDSSREYTIPPQADGTFKVTNYYAPDLTSADYTAVNPGVYFFNNGNSYDFIFPDCTLMVGQTITLWNRASGGNIDFTGLSCSITNPDNSLVSPIPEITCYTFVATPTTWLKTN